MGTGRCGGAGKRLARFSLVLGLVAVLALWSGVSPAHAAPATTTTITTCDEAHLDSAITSAASGDTLTFGCSGTINLTQTLTLSENLTLDGSGQSVTLDGNNSVRVLHVDTDVSLTLNALTISHGNSSADGGGGVYNNGGTVTISNSTFANDVTSDFDGGGAVFNNGGTVTISNSTFANNQAVGHNGGGGIRNYGGTATISNSTFANNQADFGNGGGIQSSGTLTISNSTFVDNSSFGAAPGGGLEVDNGTATISNSTFSGNSSGSFAMFGGTATVSNSTFAGNSSAGFVMYWGTATIGSSLFANNTGANCDVVSGQAISAGYNLESGTDCGFTDAGDLQTTDPKLAPLANYGGPTQTMALLSGSPAIGASKSCSVRTDQRAFARGSSSCDIGAFDTDGVPAVSSLAAQAQDGQVTLSWQDTSYPVSAYRVVLIGGSGSVGSVACSDGTCTTTISSLTNGTTYTFAVLIAASGPKGGAAAQITATPKGLATLSLGNLTQTYDGTPRRVTVTTNPANLTAVSVTYAGTGGTTYASSTTPPTNAGSYSVTASLTNPTYAAAPATGTLVVNQAQTRISAGSSANPSVSGQPVTFTATVSVQSPGGGTPTGTVQFAVDGSNAGSPVTLSGGSATGSAIATLSVANHEVTATYNGDGNFKGSDNTASPLSQVVNKASTSTSLTSSANPSAQGQTVTFTATVSVQSPGAGSVSGSVTFMDGTTTLGTGTVTNGAATYATSNLAVGSHSITVVYGGSSTMAGSATSSALTQNVDTNLSSFPKLPSGAYNLTNTNLSGAYLVGANLAGASISNTNLKGANLSGASLKGASITNTNLSGANLSGVDLSNADLSGANLSGANLSGANLANANLTGATLKGATGLKTATLTGVIWSKTTCPDSTVSNQDGGTCLGHL